MNYFTLAPIISPDSVGSLLQFTVILKITFINSNFRYVEILVIESYPSCGNFHNLQNITSPKKAQFRTQLSRFLKVRIRQKCTHDKFILSTFILSIKHQILHSNFCIPIVFSFLDSQNWIKMYTRP